VINTVYNILKPLNVPIQYILRPDISTSKIGISYHFFNEGYGLYSDGNGNEFGGSLQVDIFSTIDYSNVVEQVKTLLKEKGFRLADMRDSEDSLNANIQYYQKILIFNYSEREVKA
jgi:hypothetical protein